MQGSTNRRIKVQACLGKKQALIPKTTNAKRTGGVAQVVGYLHSKCKALNSTLNTAKTKQNKTKQKPSKL
jgi:hypothetical protein